MKKGFVYVFSNPAMPGLVKVGMTERHPEQRATELHTTGVPAAFQIDAAIYCSDAERLEYAFHCYASSYGYRVSDNREFFKMDPEHAVRLLLSLWCDDNWAESISISHPETVLDTGDVSCYAASADLHPFDITQALRFMDDEQWKSAGVRYKAELARRRSAKAVTDDKGAET
jgi:hypothetical protein